MLEAADLTPAQVTESWRNDGCDLCDQTINHRCRTKSGALCSPHLNRRVKYAAYLNGQASKQDDIDHLQGKVDDRDRIIAGANTQILSLRASLDDAQHLRQGDQVAAAAQAADLRSQIVRLDSEKATAEANTASLADQLKTARAGAALVPALQQQVADLLAKIALLETPPPPADEVLIRLDLSKVPLGPLTAVGAGLAFGQAGKIASDNFWRFHTVIADPDGRRWLRWFTAKGTEGSAFGISLGIAFPKRVDHCAMAYTLRFSPGFGWSYGGKLWGVSATTGPGISPTLASGGHDPGSAGASSRVMWLTPGSYKSLAPLTNSLAAYWYAPGKTEQNLFTKREVAAGVPIDLVLESAMNTPGKADGLVSLRQDGVELVRNETMPWRTDAASQWSHLFPNEFRGGPNDTPQWSAPTDGWIDIADGLVVTTPA